MAKVKRYTDGEWKNFGESPVSTPIIRDYSAYPYTISTNLGVYPNSSSYKTVGTLTIPKTGKYTFTWGVACSHSSKMSYQLKKNGAVIQAETAAQVTQQFSLELECEADDVFEMLYKSAAYSSGGTYYLGFGGALIAYYDWQNQ